MSLSSRKFGYESNFQKFYEKALVHSKPYSFSNSTLASFQSNEFVYILFGKTEGSKITRRSSNPWEKRKHTTFRLHYSIA